MLLLETELKLEVKRRRGLDLSKALDVLWLTPSPHPVTERAGHAKDLVSVLDLSSTDA